MVQELPEGTVTVLFTDGVGSTELTHRIGDEAARGVLGARDDVVRAQVEKHRGQEVKGTGDGLMVAFTSARRAVACAIDIQRAVAELNRSEPGSAVELRIGLNTGDVIREESDLFGATVNAAQRIQDRAAGGEILVSEGVRVVLGSASSVELEDRGEVELKGFPEPLHVYAVAWRAANQALPAGGRTPYVGREEERAELRRRIDEALEGRGSLVMIGGEPGVGKTRLAEELMAEGTERGMLALIGHSYETEGSVPYTPYVEMLEQAVKAVDLDGLRQALGDAAPQVAKLLPELRQIYADIPLPAELPPDQERRYLFNGMRQYLARATEAQPLLFVLDDLHWADDSTLQLLQHLAQDVPQQRLMIVGTYRDVELDVGRPLARTLEDLLRHRIAHRMSLRRLPEQDVAAMLRALSGQDAPAGLVHAVFSETEGNAFFVEEVFHHLSEEGRLLDDQGRWLQDLNIAELDVPEGVRLVVGRRLERVGNDCRRALGAAAVIGRRFRYELLEALDEISPEALLDVMDDAEHAHLVVPEEGRAEAWYTFAHELIRQTLLTGLSLPRRQRMHLRVAEALERLYDKSPDEHAVDLAHHLYQAGAAADPEKTCHYLAAAGQQALDAAAFEEAARLFDEALSVLPGGDGSPRADLLYRRGLAVRSVGRWEDALDDWREALRLFEEAGDGAGAAELCLRMTEQLGWNALWPESAQAGQRGLALLGTEPSAERCKLLAITAFARSLGGSYDDGMALLDEAEAVARELDDALLVGRVLAIRGSTNQWYLRPRDALRDGLQGIPLLRKAGDLWQLVDTLFAMGYACSTAGELDKSQELAREAIEIAERIGHLGGVMAAQRGMRTIHFARTGDLDELERFAREDLELSRQSEMPWESNAHTNLAMMHFWRGAWPQALAEAATAVSLEPPGMLDGWDTAHAMMIRAYAGDADGALAAFEAKHHLLPKAARANTTGSWTLLGEAVEALAIIGRRSDAAQLYPLLPEMLAGGALMTWPATLIHMSAGIASGAGGAFDTGQEHFETALRQAHELPNIVAQPETRRWYASMLLDRRGPGDQDRARTLLQEALELYSRIGMPKHVELASAMLRS